MDLDIFDQAEALIRHWLGQAPADDKDTFIRQTTQALWLEERHNNFLARLMGAIK